ncbi:uncharacterized protein ACOB7L_006381 [Callospermophilus lateralis]|uniref:uncharacterized protein LOC143640503 n=2 Tax=Callospermophilus lateralis TaxID=76772 RepID=UPI0040546DA1
MEYTQSSEFSYVSPVCPQFYSVLIGVFGFKFESDCEFKKIGGGIARLEVLLNKIESLQTTPEKLGRSELELAERSSGEGGEFAKCPWPESLPPRATSSEAERSWRGRVAEGLKKSAGSLQTVPAAARSAAALQLGGGGGHPGRDLAQVPTPQAPGATTPSPAAPRAVWAGWREVIPAAAAPAQQEDIINGAREKCVLPPMDGYPHYEGKIKWMKDMWRSDCCYADYGVDGSTCSFFIYLSENRKIYLDIIHTYMEVHATVYGSSTKNISSYVKNHGILNGRDLQFLLRETKQVCPGHQKKKRRGSYGRKIPAASGSREIIITDIRDCWADIPASVC